MEIKWQKNSRVCPVFKALEIFFCKGMVKILNLLLGDRMKGVISRTINTDIPIRCACGAAYFGAPTLNVQKMWGKIKCLEVLEYCICFSSLRILFVSIIVQNIMVLSPQRTGLVDRLPGDGGWCSGHHTGPVQLRIHLNAHPTSWLWTSQVNIFE
jgi:hypothetical protein